MTKREAAIVAAFTGRMIGDFGEMHRYIEEIMERQVWTHEMGNKKIAEEIRNRARKDFVNLEIV